MHIYYNPGNHTFHLCNRDISYIMTVLPNGQMGQLYFGRRIHHKDDFSYLLETRLRPMSASVFDDSSLFSMEHIRQEYGLYGTTDFRHPAVEILQENGSRISDFVYREHEIADGKPPLDGLPTTYTESPQEAKTLLLHLEDPLTHIRLTLLYTIFARGGILTRSARLTNHGAHSVQLTRAMSLCLDLPDCDWEWLQFSGAWSRERYPKLRPLEQGITAVDSLRGHSSHHQNPFLVLKRHTADETQGEVIGCSLVYSGNFLAQAQVDTYDTTRILLGIHPAGFSWKLEPGASFQTPEAVMVHSVCGLGGMSRTFHTLYRERLARGFWRDRERPILINNWEATYFDFTQDRLLDIAKAAKDCGVELFVLDDGWFGKRDNERRGLGDWTPNPQRLAQGIAGLAEHITALGLRFGLWFEPEMVNRDSDLFRAHPDWVIETPGRHSSHGRFQYVLDFSRAEVVDHIYDRMAKLLREADISYIKWDMNRSITECYSGTLPADRQGEVFHRYILGVYSLYERLTAAFPHILFESCASGGGRFDPGLLYYAPQTWTSDDSDAVERLKIQYGTSFCYPVSSMGSHVSVVPNHQVNRITPLHTRANVAYFGTFGYELDPGSLTDEEKCAVKEQIAFMKQYRRLIQFGDFYRLASPFGRNTAAWMCVSGDRRTAVIGWYRILNGTNLPFERIRLQGLDPELPYEIWEDNTRRGGIYYGDELMHAGLITSDASAGQPLPGERPGCDFDSRIFVLQA